MHRFFLFRGLIWFLTVGSLVLTGDFVHAQGRKSKRPGRDLPLLIKQHTDLHAKFARSMEDLARACDEKGLKSEAERIRALAAPLETAEVRLNSLPRDAQPQLPGDLPPDERFWRTQLQHHQQEYAKNLYLLSRQVLNAGHVSLAFDLVREVAVHDPDHAGARKILGFVRSKNKWVSPFEALMVKAKKVWHDQFGWIPEEHVDRYERGERLVERRWVSAAKEAEIRRDFDNAWEIKTEHYLVRTNHSLERGVELARKLEDFHGLFFQTFAGYFSNQDQLKQLYEPAARALPIPEPNEVHYYRTRDEYIQVLKQKTEQDIEMTQGIYFPVNGIAYFFENPEAEGDSTLYHEATHQLLSGSRKTGPIGMKANFWVIEGIACYMESFQRDGDRFSVGDPAHVRVQAARMNFMKDGYYVPLREFSAMGMKPFQLDKNVRKNYSQSAALCHFFMHYEEGRYREALIEHLSQIYSTREKVRESPDSLSTLTGVDNEELDRQYGKYIQTLSPEGTTEPAATIAE